MSVSLFQTLPAVLLATLLCSCSSMTLRIRKSEVARASYRASGPHRSSAAILEELRAGRARFLSTGDPRGIFDVFYFHVTAAILDKVQCGAVNRGDLILEMLGDFYESYASNRSPVRRETHWQPYYEVAEKSAGIDFNTGRKLLQLATSAHIDSDLPRVVARLLERHPNLRGYRLRSLHAAFGALDEVFMPAALRGFSDLAEVLPNAPGRRILYLESCAARVVVQHKRRRAWEKATEHFR